MDLPVALIKDICLENLDVTQKLEPNASLDRDKERPRSICDVYGNYAAERVLPYYMPVNSDN